jgi:DNA-binding transcriptional ArsR family regulator
MGEERVALGHREQERLVMLRMVEERRMTRGHAAGALKLSIRQIGRLLSRLREEGAKGLVHRLRGRRSNRRFPEGGRRQALALLSQEKYRGFGPTLASEHLWRIGVSVSRETTRRWMSGAGLWRSRKKRVKKVHVWRERRAAFGELVLLDSSDHDWLEGRGPRLKLIALIDDATSRLRGRFFESETTEANMLAMREWIECFGLPLSLYTDRHSIYAPPQRSRTEEDLHGPAEPTQFGRALEELGIEWIPAYSPQAKGRVERLFDTLQDRLVKEMRVADIDSCEDANRFLEDVFVPFWQRRFTVQARNARDAHRPLTKTHDLDAVFSLRHTRVLDAAYTLSFQGQRWRIPRSHIVPGLRKARVQLEQRLNGALKVRFRAHTLSLEPAPAPQRADTTPARPVADRSTLGLHRSSKPRPTHPWRTAWSKAQRSKNDSSQPA